MNYSNKPNLNLGYPTLNPDSARDINSDKLVSEAIDSYQKWFTNNTEKTNRDNAMRLKKYCEFAHKSPEELIEEYNNASDKQAWIRDTKQKIQTFYQSLIDSGLKLNSCRTISMGILTFYTNYCQPIPKVSKNMHVEIPTYQHCFTQQELTKMFNLGDLEEKTMLSLAINLGLSTLDFLTLETEKLLNEVNKAKQNNEDFHVFLGSPRHKTSLQPIHVLIPETIQLIQDFSGFLQHKFGKLPKYLFVNGNTQEHITETALNNKLKSLCQKANIELNGDAVTFNLMRKYLYSLIESINPEHAKYLCAKDIKLSNATYSQNKMSAVLETVKKAYPKMTLLGSETLEKQKENSDRIGKLENAILNLSKDLMAYKTVNETLTTKYEGLEHKLLESFDRQMSIIEKSITQINGMTKEDALKTLTELKPKQIVTNSS